MPERRFNLKLLTEIDIPARLFKTGETIFHEGEEGNELFIIRSGGVRISVDGRTLDELRENDLFGEMALVDNSPRAATATALTDVELIPIGEKQFLFLVDETPYFALTVMRIMADRLRKQNRSGG